jgi:hypothetical protein
MGPRLRAVIVGWLLLLAACGGTDEQATTTTTYNPPSTVASTTTLPARGLSGAGPGLVVVRCVGGTSYSVSVLDMATARQRGEVRFDVPYDRARPRFGCNPRPPWALRASFNAVFDELAVTAKQPNGSSHVAAWGAGGKDTVDLTPPDNAYGSVVLHYDPLFQPTTGHLWFLADDKPKRETTLMRLVERSGGVPRSVTPWPTLNANGPPLSFVFGPKTDWAVTWEEGRAPLPNPSARIAAAGDWQVLRRDSNAWASVAVTGDRRGECEPQAWVDDHRLLCLDTPGRQVVRLVSYSADYATAEVRPLLPEASRTTTTGLVVSPAGDEYAFVSVQGGVGGVYSVFRQSLAGGEPVKVTDIEGTWLNVMPLEWR